MYVTICIYIYTHASIWVFPKIGVPQNGWFITEHPIKLDDLGVPLFSETPISSPRCRAIPGKLATSFR